MDTLGRVVRSVPAGSGSTSNLFADLRALGSGTGYVFLTSNVNHLASESTYRMLASVPGFAEILRPSPTGTSSPTQPSDFDWLPSLAVPWGGGDLPAVVCLGSHAVYRVAGSSTTWPKLVLRARVEPPSTGGDKLAYCLAVVPGIATSPSVFSSFTVGTIPGGASWVDLVAELALGADDVAPVVETPTLGSTTSGVPALGETVSINGVTVWASFFTTAGKCQCVALTLSLEPV